MKKSKEQLSYEEGYTYGFKLCKQSIEEKIQNLSPEIMFELFKKSIVDYLKQ